MISLNNILFKYEVYLVNFKQAHAFISSMFPESITGPCIVLEWYDMVHEQFINSFFTNECG